MNRLTRWRGRIEEEVGLRIQNHFYAQHLIFKRRFVQLTVTECLHPSVDYETLSGSSTKKQINTIKSKSTSLLKTLKNKDA